MSEPWYIPVEVYNEIMSRPDGADLSDIIMFEDPEWVGFTITKGTESPPPGPEQ